MSLYLCICCKQLKRWIHLFVTAVKLCLLLLSTKIFSKIVDGYAEKMEKPILLFSRDFKCSAEHSFVVTRSDPCLCSMWTLKQSRCNCRKCHFRRITCESGFRFKLVRTTANRNFKNQHEYKNYLSQYYPCSAKHTHHDQDLHVHEQNQANASIHATLFLKRYIPDLNLPSAHDCVSQRKTC